MGRLHTLPTNLAPLADVAAKPALAYRYGLAAVRVAFPGDGSFTADATDAHALMRVAGPTPMPADDFPGAFGVIVAADPRAAAAASIPPDRWKDIQRKAAKPPGRKGRKTKPAALACVCGEKVTVFGITPHNENMAVESVPNAEGRFPPADDVLKPREGGMAVTVDVDARLLARVLTAAAGILGDSDGDGITRVTLEVRADGDRRIPVRVTGRNAATGQTLTAVVQPLA